MNKIAFGTIVILNGPPRSGKSTIAKEIQANFEGVWLNLGVDSLMAATPQKFQPGIGLRPGGERPDLEPMIHKLYLGLYESFAAYSRRGINIVADLGQHHDYAIEGNFLPECLEIIKDYPVLLVGIHCPIEVIMERRIQTWHKGYQEDGSIPQPILRWQEAVHEGMRYDVEIDTSKSTSKQCAELIHQQLLVPNTTPAIKLLTKN